jgi:hypothetical protein
MGKIVKAVLSVAAIVAGVVTFNPGLIAAGISIGSSVLRPKPPRNSPANADRLRANIDPLTPRKTVIGNTAMATDVRDEEFTGNQEFFHRFIVCASHKVQSIDEIWFDDKRVWTATSGVEGEAVGYLTVTTRTEGSAANAINISARMGSTRRYTGLAYVYLRYKLTGNSRRTDSPYAQSIPTRITIRGKGAALPDPRNPAHDMADQTTWTWSDSASRNPALALLFYLLGYKINGKLAVGKGIPPERIDLDSFVTAANICDELVSAPGGGTEPRYRCDGVWSEGDSPTTVIDMLKSCMNADLDDVGGKLRLTVFHNDLATPVADFSDIDIIDAFTWQPEAPLDSTFNVVRGVYTDPSNNSLYQQVDYPEQREASPDSIDRIDTFNLPMVQSAGQAQRLAQLRLQRQKYAGVFEAEFQASAWKITKNSVIRLSFSQTGFSNKFFRVAEMEVRQDGIVPLKLREEDPAIYGDPPLTAPISPIFSTPFDPALNPLVLGINRWRGEYASGATYAFDDLVTGPGNAQWRYINATPAAGQALPIWPATSNAYWENFTPPLDPPDVGLESGATRNVARGTYDAGTTYLRGDEVIFSGSTYRLIVESSTGNSPPDVLRWALVAQAGAGPAGADGLPGISVLVSNEAHVVATAQDGSGGDYNGAGGTMQLLRGDTVLTPTFSIAAQTPASPSWISINASTGVYTVTDPGVDLATATIRATWAGVNYDRTYTLAKSKQGVTGPRLALVADAQAFTFTDGAANPGSQTITLTALLNNLSGTATWSTTPAVTLGGTGNTRTLTVANFGTNRQVTIEATLGGITDRVTLVRVDRDVVAPANANRIRFSRMEGGRGWATFSEMPITTAIRPVSSGGRVFIRTDANATAAGQRLFAQIDVANRFRVFAGERLSASAAIEARRLTGLDTQPAFWQLYLDFFDSAGGATGSVEIASGSGNALADVRRAAFITVPANSVAARMVLRMDAAAAGPLYSSIVEPMVASAAIGQTVHPAYVPGLNAVDGALPNDLITIGGDGLISGIGTAGINVDNRRAALQGLASARPASGQFIGQEYHATDTREISQWDGFNWRASADITASAQRTIEPQFPVIEIKQGEAGHTGNRTVTHAAKRGTATLTGGTWSLPAQNLGAGSASINASTGTVTLSGIVQSGSYTVRYTHTDAFVTDLPVNVTYVPSVAAGVSATVTGVIKDFETTSFAAVTNDLSIQLPSGVTQASLYTGAIVLDALSLPAGTSNVEMKWQRESSPGTWTDIGSAASSSPSPSVADSGGFPDPTPGSITCNRTATGLTAGSAQTFRLVARISSGTTRIIYPQGTATAGG